MFYFPAGKPISGTRRLDVNKECKEEPFGVSPKWEDPYQVLLTTARAVKIAERSTWIHLNFVKRSFWLKAPPGEVIYSLIIGWTQTFRGWRDPKVSEENEDTGTT
ncbi:hypothetical protein XENORESO_021338 [Xenotaenia resolanae]|uniref:Uncharacterized protein n=1 Tax=Xenotaenia resolanae TaxID=208358 RepID=A0ABV0WXR2_9TELE